MKTLSIKRRLLVGIIISFVFLSGCGHEGMNVEHTEEGSSRSQEYSPQKAAKSEAKEYFEFLKSKDIQSLEKLFSEDVKNSHDLEKEWAAFFDAIDGNIVSYKIIKVHGEGMNVDDKKVTFSDLVVSYEDVQTDSGKTYESIDYRQVRVDEKHPGAEGISLFSVILPSDDGKDTIEKSVGEIIIY